MIHATVDLGQMVEWISQQLQLEAGENGCLAVLHNGNDMASALNSSDWVVNSEGKVISRGVTSCAGMTAQHVLLATKISFLTGGRGYNSNTVNKRLKGLYITASFNYSILASTHLFDTLFSRSPDPTIESSSGPPDTVFQTNL